MKPEYLKHYVEAINKIDDYFEYRSDSLKDRNFVYGVLDKLSDNLKTLEEANEPSKDTLKLPTRV
jgi:hypothetical protein